MSIRKALSFALVLSLLWTSVAYAALPDQPVADTPEDQGTDVYSHRLIVQLASPSLAAWAQESPELLSAKGRLDVANPQAVAYVDRLKMEQAAFVREMKKLLPDAAVSTFVNESGMAEENAYQLVFNGVTIDPGSTDRDAALRMLLELPEVKQIYLDRAHTPQLYTSTLQIDAPAMWNSPAIGGHENAGEGVFFASMDGGVHHDAPMFDGTDYTYPPGFQPNGLGYTSNNNGKIIVSRAYFRTWDPPVAGDDNPWPGEYGTPHGNHTASTAAGDIVTATLLSKEFPNMSGVAPKAYVMSYRVFYWSEGGLQSFFDAEGIAALEDIVADGAEVLNNSWGGGPGSVGGEYDALDTALRNAVAAGVFVSMSAGNAGPGYGTGDHPSDPYISVAAVQSGGAISTGRLNAIEPEPALLDIPFTLSAFGASPPIGEIITYTYKAAENVDADNYEGCEAWPADTFTGHAAVISRGTCEFGLKVYNAQEAGAEFVVVHNHASGGEELITMAGGVYGSLVTIPSVFIGYTDGVSVTQKHADAETAGVDAVLELDFFTATQIGNQADVVANFSSRGPGVGNVLKPDVAAPGVNILAQGYTPGATGEARHLGYGQASGTSMSAPHAAGAAILLKQMYPSWTPADIKSALMSTAKYMEIYNADGTPAQPLDVGAGRIDLGKAMDPGVILDPPSLSFGAVVSGTDKTMTVTANNVTAQTEVYTLTTLYTGDSFTETTALPGFTVSPMTITIPAGGSEVFTVTFESDDSMGIGDNQGYVLMEGDVHDAHLPAWARVLAEPAEADVLLVDVDASWLLGFPDYLSYYTNTLDNLGLTYDIWTPGYYYANPATVPEAAVLSAYDTVVLFTGDFFYPDGSFTVSTPLTQLDMDRLTEYANQGGKIIGMGQDLSAVLASDATEQGTFFYSAIMGGNFLRDGVAGAGVLPKQRIVPLAYTPEGFQGVAVDLLPPEFYTGMGNLTADAVVTYDIYMPVTVRGGTGSFAAPVTTQSMTATDALTGTATFDYEVDSARLDYIIDLYTTTAMTVTDAEIHEGAAGTNGPTLYELLEAPVSFTDTVQMDGTLVLEPAEAAAFEAGELYLLVRTEDMPVGAVRAQVMPMPEGDGAANQAWVDEISPNPSLTGKDPTKLAAGYMPLLRYPGDDLAIDGVVAMAHRDQPTLERPGVSYYGRSIYTTFGLEGVNNGLPGATTREELMTRFLDWLNDEPAVSISMTSTMTSTLTRFTATLPMTVSAGATYRWDFGDGSDFTDATTSTVAGHTYDMCGTYTVRVEATNAWGNTVIGSEEFEIESCMNPMP
ncbi:MAG: S8 family serine peptidase [Anaerolineae bacterium]